MNRGCDCPPVMTVLPAGAGENNPRQWFEAVLGFQMQAGDTAASLEPFQKEQVLCTLLPALPSSVTAREWSKAVYRVGVDTWRKQCGSKSGMNET